MKAYQFKRNVADHSQWDSPSPKTKSPELSKLLCFCEILLWLGSFPQKVAKSTRSTAFLQVPTEREQQQIEETNELLSQMENSRRKSIFENDVYDGHRVT